MTVYRIVVGVDGSPGSQAALGWVAELAAQLGAHVTAVHVFEPLAKLGDVEPPYDIPGLADTARTHLDGEWVQPLAAAKVAHDTVFAEGSPADRLADIADDVDADLIVVGDRGHSTVRKLVIGSTALKLPHETSRPVTIIRQTD